MKCPKTHAEVSADDCEECVSNRTCYEWCLDHLVWRAIGEPQFVHPMGKYGERLGEILSSFP